jgi:large subunit ribosomal protein L17
MRHQKAGRKFSRTSAHRDAMFSNMVASLITHERILTTVPKAKELKRLADRTISWGLSVGDATAKPRDKRTAAEKANIVHAMRMARRVVKSDDALEKLFGEVAARFKGRPGGFTRLLKAWQRRGDAAPMAFVELTVMAEPTAEAAPIDTDAAAADDAGDSAAVAKPKKTKGAKAAKGEAAAAKAQAAAADDAGEEAAPEAGKAPKAAETKGEKAAKKTKTDK